MIAKPTTVMIRQWTVASLALLVAASTSIADQPRLFWAKDSATPDTYVAFRGGFELPAAGEVELHLLGSSWYVVWLDGDYFGEGPDRFDMQHPQYQVQKLQLNAGRHVLAVQAQHLGLTTRMLVDMPPFLYCEAFSGDKRIEIDWKCRKLEGYSPCVRRINPQLGWIEWCDTRRVPEKWRETGFDDSTFAKPQAASPKLGELTATSIGPVKHFVHALQPIAQGPLAENFGYELDDVAARFFLRDLECKSVLAQGVWRRYDLGRVRLGRPRFKMNLPAGAVVEFAYSESLAHGRVHPYITLSTGPSCNLDHYIARGGVQEFFPLTPKGGRFLEVHVLAGGGRIEFGKEEYIERSYHGPAEGSFVCNDELLNRIWATGVETFRACAEDALIDNPTRERGQWTGDVVSVGMDINAVAFGDLRLCRRGLMQSGWCAREDGMVAGLCPGGPAYLTTYAAQWVSACMHHYELTGDKSLLEQMYPQAVRNIAAFEKFTTQDGLIDGAGWGFVDWGYVRNEGPADMGLNLHYLAALRAMSQWCKVLEDRQDAHPPIGKHDDAAKYDQLAGQIEGVARAWLEKQLGSLGEPWEHVGYHNTVLAMRDGLIAADRQAEAVAYIKRHILNCFPNNPDAPRLSDPAAANRQLITPYFAHYAFPVLIEHGELDFVLDQYRKCWGWALQDGRTTWVEVFDPRWTHCHQWAGCPTWQLSRYVLGLQSRFDLGMNHYVLVPGFSRSLASAEGKLPLTNGKGAIQIKWKWEDSGASKVTIETPEPIWIHPDDPNAAAVLVKDRYEHVGGR